jgi:two-component system, OmpR family, sensor histidine kinase BaeS
MRLRLFLAFGLIIAVTLGAVAVFVRQGTESEVRSFIARGGTIGAEDLVTALESHYKKHNSWEGADQLFLPQRQNTEDHGQGNGQGQGQTRGGNLFDLRLVDKDGTILYDPYNPENPTMEIMTPDEMESAILLKVDNQLVGYLLPDNDAVLPGSNFEDRLLSQLNQASRDAALIAGLLALLLALLLATFILRPVHQLTGAAAKLAEGDLSQRVSIRSGGELSTLGNAFNNMADSLEQASSTRRSMTADIAHELRTPLAVQRANLEALQDGVYEPTAENLEIILEQNHLLTRLVEDLRTLALADAGELAIEQRTTDLIDLAKRTIEHFQSQAAQKNIFIHSNFPDSCPQADVDPERIQQILHNLLQNSLRHTHKNGQVRFTIDCNADTVQISVHDSGPGIPEDSIEHVFERFYRADRSRSRGEGGTGLGLSIARKLAEAHHGTLTAENHPEGGAAFILTIPIRSNT